MRWRLSVFAVDPPSHEELQREIEPDSLLPGEDLDSPRFEDALHWCRVYSELLAVRLAMVTHTASVLRGVSDDAFREVNLQQRLLRLQVDRCRSRLAYWTSRADELAAPVSLVGRPVRRGDPVRV